MSHPLLVHGAYQEQPALAPEIDADTLTLLDEPSLREGSHGDARVYRFVLFRALAYETPVSIRLNVNVDGTGTLTVKTALRGEGAKRGKLKSSKTRTISQGQVERFLSLVEKVDYWHMPTEDPKPPGLDGSVWVIEAVENAKYRQVERWSPENGGVRELGRMLAKLAGLSMRETA